MFENAKKWIHIVNAGFSGWKEAAGDVIATPGYVSMVAGAEAPERVFVSTPGYTGYLVQEDANVALEGVLCGAGA